jgi:hypothetical protein
MAWQPGDTFTINVNQGDREAMVLAVIGNQALIEYVMPAGTTALQVVTEGREQIGRSVSYPAVPTKWLRAIVEDGREWEGNPQGRKKISTAEAMLAQRGHKALEPLAAHHPIGCLCGDCGVERVRDGLDPRDLSSDERAR